jgi:hypothetical protein
MAMTQTEVVLMRKRRELDHALLALIAALAAAGFVMMGSASMDYAGEQYGNPFYHIIRHGIYLLLGAATMYLTLQIPVKLWQDAGPALLVSGMAILALLLVPGDRARSQRRDALDRFRSGEPAALRGDETVLRRVPGRLHDAASARTAEQLVRHAQAARAARRRGPAAAARARLRRRGGDRRRTRWPCCSSAARGCCRSSC